MRFITVLCLLIVSFVCLNVAQGSYEDCCLKYYETKIRKSIQIVQKHAVSYKQQVTDGGCNIPAIIFKMRKGRIYCTNPKDKWVTDLMKKIDERQRDKSKSKPQKKHHKG